MNTQLKIEHALLFALGLYAFQSLGISWWWFWGLILVPDVVALQVAGIILFTHSNMDRILGYGLKYPDDFKHTHLGWIGGDSA